MGGPQSSTAGNSSNTHLSTSLRQLEWDDSNHISVLTQLNGSVWPRVWPYCLVNAMLTSAVFIANHQMQWEFLKTSSTDGHRYLAMIMSFLVVVRVKILYDRYMQDSHNLQECLRCTREVVYLACHLTSTDRNAQIYRHEVAAAALRLLNRTMQVLDLQHAIREEKITTVPRSLQVMLPQQHNTSSPITTHISSSITTLSEHQQNSENDDSSKMGPRAMLTKACRAPIHCAHMLRATIMSQRGVDKLAEGTFQHPCNEELRLLDSVATYVKALSRLESNLSTPIPFPLVQMAKTILFVWLYTLPFALPMATHDMLMSMVLIFLITYGFLGLECVAMELADCFGDDACDIDNEGAAEQCAEDCYLAIYKTDGRAWAFKLRDVVEMEQDQRFRRPAVPQVFRF